MHVEVSAESWQRFKKLVAAYHNHGSWHREKAIREFAIEEGWLWMPTTDRKKMVRWAHVIAAAYSDIANNGFRKNQLRVGGFLYWTYVSGRSGYCHPSHAELNGVVLWSDHPFWETYFPPNGWDCKCHVFGARTTDWARRMGGDPSKHLPKWWEDKAGIDHLFEGDRVPTLEEVMELLTEGHFD